MSTPRNNLDELRRQRGNGSRAQTPEPSTSSARVIDFSLPFVMDLVLKMWSMQVTKFKPSKSLQTPENVTSKPLLRMCHFHDAHALLQSGNSLDRYPPFAHLDSAKTCKPLSRNIHLLRPSTPASPSKSHPTTMLLPDALGCPSSACPLTLHTTLNHRRRQSVRSLTLARRRKISPSARVARARQELSLRLLWNLHPCGILRCHREEG